MLEECWRKSTACQEINQRIARLSEQIKEARRELATEKSVYQFMRRHGRKGSKVLETFNSRWNMHDSRAEEDRRCNELLKRYEQQEIDLRELVVIFKSFGVSDVSGIGQVIEHARAHYPDLARPLTMSFLYERMPDIKKNVFGPPVVNEHERRMHSGDRNEDPLDIRPAMQRDDFLGARSVMQRDDGLGPRHVGRDERTPPSSDVNDIAICSEGECEVQVNARPDASSDNESSEFGSPVSKRRRSE